jgi:hypothetical protein
MFNVSFFIVNLIVHIIILGVYIVMLSDVMLSAFILSVMAPFLSQIILEFQCETKLRYKIL